ncbi:PREDICTED: HMG domain-containing protein 3 [Nanorana parkeri]|uniref:HMG domain-containing protein 3 n=1 Tax=Nanorana parkeri TaxID=125878 RepID=UPI0008547FB8|nr:PREDICTED: HMG domain-containing protein 3 [Nanorana parkeri]
MDDPFDGTEVTVVSEEIEGNYVPAKPPVKKKKYRGCTEQRDSMKKPRSAYLLYYYDIYLKVQQEVPHLPQSEINKKISESWKLLSVAEKSYYLERAKLEKEGLDPNIKSGPSTVISDVPGFRKILPRSEYILVPKPAAEEDVSLNYHRETAVLAPSAALSHSGGQNVCTLEAGLSEQLIDLEGLANEGANAVREVIAGGMYSHCAGTDKVAGELILDDATLEIGETNTYPATSMVIEEDGGLAVARSDLHRGMSVVTVMAIQDTEDNSTPSAPSQFIMLPMTNRSVTETSRSIKLATTYTRRGRGSCTNPTCTFSYVTRHKPPVCPLCNKFLGGKWIPKEDGHPFLNSAVAIFFSFVFSLIKTLLYTTAGGFHSNMQLSGIVILSLTFGTYHIWTLLDWIFPGLQPLALPLSLSLKTHSTKQPKEKPNITVRTTNTTNTQDQSTTVRESKAFEKENSEAVSQLLQSSQPAHTEDWEEVIISDAHFEPNQPQEKPTEKQKEKSTKSAEQDVTKTDKPPPAGSTKAVPQASVSKTSSSSASSLNKPPEAKSFSKPLAIARPIRAILPAPTNSNRSITVECTGNTLTFIKPETYNNVTSVGLKASTLKQLGQAVLQQPIPQEITVRADLPAPLSQPEHKVVTDPFPSYKYNCPVALDLGLATQRGRGKCKNPFCDFVYTNRHKPKVCPNCGINLKDKVEKGPKLLEAAITIATAMSMREPLTQSQKEIQRHSTLQLIRKTVQIPENECELSDTFALIQELNSSPLVLSNVHDGTVTIEQTSWASIYESPADRCLLCGTKLFKGDKNSMAGPQDCWLLTANRLQLMTAQVKVCLNSQCLAIHSFNDIYTGLFNVGNKLLVSLDLLFSIRNQLKLGEDPKASISNIVDSVQGQTEKMLSPEELVVVQDLLSCGYWAFECLTLRDYNDMICGVCGVAPKVEIAQRNVESTLTLTNIEFTWPEFLTTNEVSMEDFWSTLETEVLEQAAFPSSIPITKFDASIISPFFPPLMRGPLVVNSESYKNLEIEKVAGNGSALAKLLHDGTLKLDDLNMLSTEQLRRMLTLCGISWNVTDAKDSMCYSILALSEFVQNGTQVKQPPSNLTGGKVYKICPHQVVCGSKYIVRGESPRDHVDLLASSRHWPPVYVVDMATQVALCADLLYPNLAQQMWGKNQGCFSDPSESPKYVSCPELLDIHFNMDMMGNEPSIQHPMTKSSSRRIVHGMAEQNRSCDPTSRHHSLSLCRELEPYSAIITAIGDSKTSNIRHHSINFENATHYYLYNRLIDFLTSREIVNRQIHDIVQTCQPGEVVIRDTLYRLGVAQIKTELGDSELEEDITVEQTSST